MTGAATLTLTSQAALPGVYTAVLQNSFPAGNYTVTGTGGAGVGPFSVSLSLAPPIAWTNQPTTITRSAGQTITWTGGASNGYVVITGESSSGTTSGVGAIFICTAPASAQTFTIPAAVLLSLPPSAAIAGIPAGFLSLGSYTNPQMFSATGINYGYAVSGSSSQSLVAYQ